MTDNKDQESKMAASGPKYGEVYTRLPTDHGEWTQRRCCHSSRLSFRVSILLFSAMLTFGPSFYYGIQAMQYV